MAGQFSFGYKSNRANPMPYCSISGCQWTISRGLAAAGYLLDPWPRPWKILELLAKRFVPKLILAGHEAFFLL